MHSRGGNQVVFSSINYGTDTSAEGRMVIEELLKATIAVSYTHLDVYKRQGGHYIRMYESVAKSGNVGRLYGKR